VKTLLVFRYLLQPISGVVYLRRHYEFEEISKIQTAFGRVADEAMFQLWRAYRIPNATARLVAFENCLALMNKHPTVLIFEKQQLADQIELLRRQLVIEQFDAKQALTEEMFVKYPRSPVLFKPLVSTLGYCAFYHFTVSDSYESSPQGLRKKFNASLFCCLCYAPNT